MEFKTLILFLFGLNFNAVFSANPPMMLMMDKCNSSLKLAPEKLPPHGSGWFVLDDIAREVESCRVSLETSDSKYLISVRMASIRMKSCVSSLVISAQWSEDETDNDEVLTTNPFFCDKIINPPTPSEIGYGDEFHWIFDFKANKIYGQSCGIFQIAIHEDGVAPQWPDSELPEVCVTKPATTTAKPDIGLTMISESKKIYNTSSIIEHTTAVKSSTTATIPPSPTTTRTWPTTIPSKSTTTSTKPTTTPTKSTTKSTKPTETPTKPTATPTKPTATPTKPTATPTKPTVTPGKPTTTPTKPTATPNKPTTTQTKSTTASTKPTTEKLVVGSTEPPAVLRCSCPVSLTPLNTQTGERISSSPLVYIRKLGSPVTDFTISVLKSQICDRDMSQRLCVRECRRRNNGLMKYGTNSLVYDYYHPGKAYSLGSLMCLRVGKSSQSSYLTLHAEIKNCPSLTGVSRSISILDTSFSCSDSLTFSAARRGKLTSWPAYAVSTSLSKTTAVRPIRTSPKSTGTITCSCQIGIKTTSGLTYYPLHEYPQSPLDSKLSCTDAKIYCYLHCLPITGKFRRYGVFVYVNDYVGTSLRPISIGDLGCIRHGPISKSENAELNLYSYAYGCSDPETRKLRTLQRAPYCCSIRGEFDLLCNEI